jgi:hypothetical protein
LKYSHDCWRTCNYYHHYLCQVCVPQHLAVRRRWLADMEGSHGQPPASELAVLLTIHRKVLGYKSFIKYSKLDGTTKETSEGHENRYVRRWCETGGWQQLDTVGMQGAVLPAEHECEERSW